MGFVSGLEFCVCGVVGCLMFDLSGDLWFWSCCLHCLLACLVVVLLFVCVECEDRNRVRSERQCGSQCDSQRDYRTPV
jgi:hypothetical protein